MSTFSLILAVLLLASWIGAIKSEIKLKVNKIPEFPFPANKLFEIQITTTDPEGKLSSSLHDTMVIAIVGPDGRVIEKAILDYGFKDMIDQEYRGDLMRIPVWQKTADGKAVIARILFMRRANNGSLEIFQLAADTSADRRDKLNELPMTDRIYQRGIELLVPPKIELAIEASDGRKNEFVLDNQGVAFCRAYDGVPAVRPVFLNEDEFQVQDTDFNELENRVVLRLQVSMRDHLKTLRCRAGSTEAAVKIIVLHHPSQVTLEPEIPEGSTIENGSSVACTSVDGYPSPTMRWVLVSGPPNASGYFNISSEGRMLHMRSHTPLGSSWAFNCTATNRLPSSLRTFNRTVEFSVGRRIPEGLFGLNLTYQIMVGVGVMGAIIIFCIVIVFIVCIARKSCASHQDSRNNAGAAGTRKNGLPSKTAAEKKALEVEQVMLLPPAMSQNHMETGNSGPGYPLPPPDYHIMHENETNQVNVSLDQQQQMNGEMYPEVTYAELNTSDLPMKENKSLKASQNDEHVIYSQIIGTIMTPDCPQRGGVGGYLDTDNV